MTIPFDVVVFDLDGTLIDSAADITRALNRTLSHFGRRAVTEAETRAMVGDGATGLIGQAFDLTGAAADTTTAKAAFDHYQESYLAEDADPSCVYPGVNSALDQLTAAGARLGVCTNKAAAITSKVLDMAGLARWFPVVVGGDSLPQRKPDPAPLRHVVDALGGGRAVMVGDGLNDVKAARGLGIPVVAVTFGYPRMPVSALGADALIDHFNDLIPTLRWVGAGSAPDEGG